ncbi:hypothetical protein lbkm_0693 [Lachnospiraceae bacterium KM106-2]|nr:hypothetical protein lbkm_0693 [Lachnospiraceae bacterium KM106-2]
MDNVRIGYVSSIDYKSGTVQILYKDRDNSVTDDIPVLTMNGEYSMPAINDMVLVLHLSNGGEMGVVMGTFWNDSNKPSESGKEIYRKDFSKDGAAFMKYDKDKKTLYLHADKIILENDSKKVNAL